MAQEFDGFVLQTVAEDPALAGQMQSLIDKVWPVFVTESDAPKGHPMPWDWMGVYRRWPELQIGLRDPQDGALIAAINGLAMGWDGSVEELPDSGWNWAMHQAVLDQDAGVTPITGQALSITLDPAYRGRHLSNIAVRALAHQCRELGLRRLLAAVRPNWKARYPITPMSVYYRWTTAEGLPFDPWLRVHARLGATLIKPCDHSQPLAAPVATWEKWLDLPLPTSGEYVAPGLLTTLQVNREADEAVCYEPNVWVEHPLE